MRESLSAFGTALVVVLLLGVLLAGQAAAGAVAPSVTEVGTGQAVGRATFAYLSGLRIFAAQVLWNRIEPLFHDYYGGVALKDQTYMLPTLNAINLLDPQFDQPYYLAPWILARRGETESALEVAARGVKDNPKSGLLRMSYAQVIDLFGDDMQEALAQAKIARGDDMLWRDDIEKHDSYGVLRFIFLKAGDDASAEETLHEIERLDELIGDQLPAGSHDHDGDGVPDH